MEAARVASAVDFETLPVAALRLQHGVIVAVNAAYVDLMGINPAKLIGVSSEALVATYVTPGDLPRVLASSESARQEASPAGTMRLRATDASGRLRALRIEWRLCPEPGASLVFLVDDDHDTRVKELTDGFARASALLASAGSEREVSERAVEAIVERGFTASFLLADDDGALLRQGPSGTPNLDDDHRNVQAMLTTMPLAVDVLRAYNPRFDEGVAAFFQDLYDVAERFMPREIVELLRRARLGPHLLEVPLHVGQRLFGVLFVSGATLTPGLAGPVEMFGELIERAVEGVRMRKRLVERERLAALGEAAAVMAHEVRNPIAAILNATTLLGREGVPTGELLEVIAEESRRLDRIVSDLLTLGRPLEPKLVSTSLYALAEAARSVDVARDVMRSERILVEGADDGSERALVDPELMELAVLNAIGNAHEASPPGSPVVLRVGRRPGGRVVLCVDDAGPGFELDDASRIFEPFYTTRPAGTGVGLAVVRRFVEACGGTVEASRSPEGGARLAFSFAALPPEDT
ncbi:MAG: hypothetical protein FJ095_18250 [Deltaproteobacteria bacterium]|nr:hypothetical protein [Deltaproteobacteria bacterium]